MNVTNEYFELDLKLRRLNEILLFYILNWFTDTIIYVSKSSTGMNRGIARKELMSYFYTKIWRLENWMQYEFNEQIIIQRPRRIFLFLYWKGLLFYEFIIFYILIWLEPLCIEFVLQYCWCKYKHVKTLVARHMNNTIF